MPLGWILLRMAGLGGAGPTGVHVRKSWDLFGPLIGLDLFPSLHGLLGVPGFIASTGAIYSPGV